MKKTLKTNAAFSLIEAMIILLLISIAIMVLIPLISQKTTFPRWMPIKNADKIEAITYGDNYLQRVGIGANVTSETNPDGNSASVTTNISPFVNQSKFLSKNIAINPNNNIGVLLGDKYEQFKYTTTDYLPNNSIQLGMNTCMSAPSNSIILRSLNAPRECSDRIRIGSVDNWGGITLDNTEKFTLGTEKYQIVEISNNNFNIKFPNGNKAISYATDSDTLTIGDGSTTSLIPNGSGATLFLSASNMSYPDRYNCICDIYYYDDCIGNEYDEQGKCITGNSGYVFAGTENNKDLSYAESNSFRNVNTNTKKCTCSCADDAGGVCVACQSLGYIFAVDNSGSVNETYCKATYGQSSPGLWNSSDRRLKNIISKYKKGFDSLKNVDSYLYTFKSDKENKIHVGLIAQKIIGIFDEALSKDEDGFYSYEKSPILYAMINSVKEIYYNQTKINQKQKKLNKEADKLIRMYE